VSRLDTAGVSKPTRLDDSFRAHGSFTESHTPASDKLPAVEKPQAKVGGIEVDAAGLLARLGLAALGVLGAAVLGMPAVLQVAASTPKSPAATPTLLWSGLLERTPVPQDRPLPADEPTPLDGAYAIHEPSPPQWWSCRRCADYRPSGGTWRLFFDRGVMRILYPVTGWKNLASFEVDGETLHLFNDPICPWDRGTYRWQEDEKGLRLETVEDACAFGLRAENLSRGTWSSCRPPDIRAAVSDAWSKLPECAHAALDSAPSLTPLSGYSVAVYPNDARGSNSPPRVVVGANPENAEPPAGVVISHDAGVVPYGMNLILWEGGAWAEASIDVTADAIGVQFWGPATMGAGRILFDGQEVWRGVASELGSSLEQYGGYVEVSGFAPGRHTLRVEHLDPDGRPVTVLFFGLG